MQRLRLSMTMSTDGYVAGPGQSLEQPLGRGGLGLHDWAFATRSFRRQHGLEGGEEGLDDQVAAAAAANVGATIMGRNMFGPERGSWSAEPWRGWWGDDPPFHTAVFVLTHYPRPAEPMLGGTTFVFVTDGIESALEQAFAAAGEADVLVGGGAETARQYLRARLLDVLDLHIVPRFLGAGERLFDDLAGGPLGYECGSLLSSPAAAHLRFERTS